MPIVFDVADVRAEDVVIAPSELAELMALLHVAAEPEHHRDRRRELAALRAEIPAPLLNRLRLHAPLWARFRLRAFMPLSDRTRGMASFDAEIAEVLQLSLPGFFAMAAEAIAGERLPPERSPQVDEAAYLEHCRSKGEARVDLARRLLRDPAAFRDELVEVAAQCHRRFFAKMWAGIEPVLQQHADGHRARIQPGRVAELLASVAPDTHLFGQRGQVVFDKLQSAVVNGADRRFVLVPSIWSAPHVLVKYDVSYDLAAVPIVVQYPALQSTAGAPTLRMAQDRLSVLADESRQQICRHLVNEWCTTTELARRTGMTAPQVSRHLRRLKDVDLLVSTRDGRMVAHRLRSDLVYQLGHEFLSALTR